MNEDLLKQIKQLPPLPETAMGIEAVYQNPNSTFEDMVKILEKDPLLTADILKSANSPLYGFSREITKVSQAVSLFGMGTIRGFALASVINNSFDLDLSPYNISNMQYTKRAEEQNAFITSWYIRKNPKILGILSPAAFLIDIGKVIIAKSLLDNKKNDEFSKAIKDAESISEVERAFVGSDTAHVTAKIFDHWRFEEDLIHSIEFSDTPQEAPEEVTLCAQSLHVSKTLIKLDATLTPETIEAARTLAESYQLDLDSFDKAVENITQ